MMKYHLQFNGKAIDADPTETPEAARHAAFDLAFKLMDEATYMQITVSNLMSKKPTTGLQTSILVHHHGGVDAIDIYAYS